MRKLLVPCLLVVFLHPSPLVADNHAGKRKAIKRDLEKELGLLAAMVKNLEKRASCPPADKPTGNGRAAAGKATNRRIKSRRIGKARRPNPASGPFCSATAKKHLERIRALQEKLERILESDKDAGEIISNYPSRTVIFDSRIEELDKVKGYQREAANLPRTCKEDEKKLLADVEAAANAGDLDKFRQARDAVIARGREIESMVKAVDGHALDIDSKKRLALAFTYGKRGWRAVRDNYHASIKAIISDWTKRRTEMHDACDQMARKEKHEKLGELEKTLAERAAEEFEKRVNDWEKARDDVYKNDCDSMKRLHEAYCKKTDSETNEADGKTEADKLADKLSGEVAERAKKAFDDAEAIRDNGRVLLAAQEIKRHDEPEARIKGVREKRVSKTFWKLRDVREDNLKGARRPTVRLWLNHGKQAHKRMEREKRFSCDVRDKSFTTDAAGKVRPDCVSGDKCMIFEFKPRGGSQEAKGVGQAESYAELLSKRYTEWLTSKENGPGGQRLAKKLRKKCMVGGPPEPGASQDDIEIKFFSSVETYDPCSFDYKCRKAKE